MFSEDASGLHAESTESEIVIIVAVKIVIVFFIVSSFTVEYLAQKYLIKFKLQRGMTFFEFVTGCNARNA